jgi:tungstate transport system ATP-binding protein
VSAPAAAGLEAREVTKSFRGRKVLGGVSVTVRQGEVHAVLGPSGAGKSTLLRVLNLLEPLDGGGVYLDGEQVAQAGDRITMDAPHRKARLKMALVPQKPVAFRTTVFENAAFGLRMREVEETEIEARVKRALERLGLSALSDAPARTLSGGETQRLAFARATVLPLESLLLDEFTANLDPANVKALEAAVTRSAHEQGIGVMLVTHDLFQARRIADRVSLLWGGRIIETAPRADFFESPRDARTKAFVAGELPA